MSDEQAQALKKLNLQIGMQKFEKYCAPYGFLSHDRACHALWYYYVHARLNYEKMTKGIVLEGEPDPKFNFKQLFRTTAMLYGVAPEVMAKFWANVDMQAGTMGLPLLPKEEKYRFNTVLELRTDA